MKKINLKGISEILTEKELKNVMGGSGTGCYTQGACTGGCVTSGFFVGECKIFSVSPWLCACYV